jgi:HSP20 family protein
MARIYLERREMNDELRRLVDLLDTDVQAAGVAGECAPPFDVLESASAVEIVMDVPGVDQDALQIIFSRGMVLIAGVKRASLCRHADAAFHLAERAFGRFARGVRISGAVDAGRAKATLVAGELRIVLPRLSDRRGGQIIIPIESA